MSFIDSIVNWVKIALAPFIGQPPHMPEVTIFTIGIAVLLGVTSAAAAKLLVDYDMVRKSMKQFQAWNKEVQKARKANDSQTLAKLMKKQQAMTKLQARASMEQFKVTAVTFVPFLLLWYLLNAVIGGVTVAVSPFYLPFIPQDATTGQYYFVFWQWYFLSSFAINFPVMRLFGIGMTSE